MPRLEPTDSSRQPAGALAQAPAAMNVLPSTLAASLHISSVVISCVPCGQLLVSTWPITKPGAELAGQLSQAEAPAELIELAGQVSHVASAVAPAASEYLPASQSVHSALPVPALNLPAAQSTHAPSSGPVEPALQTHAAVSALSEGGAELAAQFSQAWAPTAELPGQLSQAMAPSAPEYVPASQRVHRPSKSVTLGWNEPIAHGLHK